MNASTGEHSNCLANTAHFLPYRKIREEKKSTRLSLFYAGALEEMFDDLNAVLNCDPAAPPAEGLTVVCMST